MNRRNFLKTTSQNAAGIALISGVAHTLPKPGGDGFSSLFQHHWVKEKDLAVTDFTAGDRTSTSLSVKWNYNLGDGERSALIPLFYPENLETHCINTLLASALNKNIVVFDSQTQERLISNRLVEIMHNILRKNSPLVKSNRITDIVHGPTTLVSGHKYTGTIRKHHTDEKTWSRLRHLMFNDLKLILPDGKADFFLAINKTPKDRFIVLHHEDMVGICVTTNDCILLGAV